MFLIKSSVLGGKVSIFLYFALERLKSFLFINSVAVSALNVARTVRGTFKLLGVFCLPVLKGRSPPGVYNVPMAAILKLGMENIKFLQSFLFKSCLPPGSVMAAHRAHDSYVVKDTTHRS